MQLFARSYSPSFQTCSQKRLATATTIFQHGIKGYRNQKDTFKSSQPPFFWVGGRFLLFGLESECIWHIETFGELVPCQNVQLAFPSVLEMRLGQQRQRKVFQVRACRMLGRCRRPANCKSRIGRHTFCLAVFSRLKCYLEAFYR